MQRWNGCLGLTTTDCLSQLGIFHLPKLKIITIGNLPVKPPQRSDLNQLASLIPGAIQVRVPRCVKAKTQTTDYTFPSAKLVPSLTSSVKLHYENCLQVWGNARIRAYKHRC